MQRYLEEASVKNPNLHRIVIAESMETGTVKTGLYCDLLSVELSIGRKL